MVHYLQLMLMLYTFRPNCNGSHNVSNESIVSLSGVIDSETSRVRSSNSLWTVTEAGAIMRSHFYIRASMRRGICLAFALAGRKMGGRCRTLSSAEVGVPSFHVHCLSCSDHSSSCIHAFPSVIVDLIA